MHPIAVVLLDGLADRAHASLGWRTANEVAHTPNLDRLVASGSNGVLLSLGPGAPPRGASFLAHWAILGYRPEEFPGRAVSRRSASARRSIPPTCSHTPRCARPTCATVSSG